MTTMRSRVDPAGAQATGSTRLLVEFVAKGAPRQGTVRRERASVLGQARQTENRISGWDAPPPQKGQTLVTEHPAWNGRSFCCSQFPLLSGTFNVCHERAVLLAFRGQRLVIPCQRPIGLCRSAPALHLQTLLVPAALSPSCKRPLVQSPNQ